MVLEAPVLIDPAFAADILEHYLPPLLPDRWGTHLLRAWNMRRDMFLFWPWYRRERDAVRWVEPAIDATDLQLRLVETLKNPLSHGDFARAAIAWTGDVPSGLRGHVLATDKDPATTHARAVLEKAGLVVVTEQPADVAARAALITRLLAAG